MSPGAPSETEAGETRRVFLFLQGPHGPFFGQLGQRLVAAGHTVWRVGFTAGDHLFWPDRASYLPFRAPQDRWGAELDGILHRHDVTDLVLYGDTRPIHATATLRARAAGLRCHVFEEGYLRPYWLTYERDGSNGNSRLTHYTQGQIAAAQPDCRADAPVPARWGETRQHVWYGALYHAALLAGRRRYPGYVPHRAVPLEQEIRRNLLRLPTLPVRALQGRRDTARVLSRGAAFHLLALQLEQDANFRAHGPFASHRDLLDTCLSAFAAGAPRDHHLVLKTHPLDDGHAALPRAAAELARAHGLTGRVHLIRGAPLAPLLDAASSMVTVNSTAALQALWRGLPVRALGRAVYARPGLVSDQPLATFFRDPEPPDPEAWNRFRGFLLATSQIRGSFYSARGRAIALGPVVAAMLSPHDPYAAADHAPPSDAAPLPDQRSA